MQVYDRLQDAFPGEAEPRVVVVKAPSVDEPRVERPRSPISASRRSRAVQVHEPVTVDVNQDRTVARIELPIVGSGSDEASYDAVSTLREDSCPETVGALAASRRV